MARRLTDARLQALTGVKCRCCDRPAAHGTGAMEEARDVSEWLVEYHCDACSETFLAWRREVDALVRRISREHAESRGRASSTLSGEIGDDGSVRRDQPVQPEHSGPALMQLRETISELASATRRTFRLHVGVDGVLTHEELPAAGATKSPPVHRDADGLERLPALRALFTRVGFERMPAVTGRGEQSLEIAWYGAGVAQSRTLRCTLHGTSRNFASDPDLSPAVIELVDSLWHLLQWVDAGGPTPPWPAAASATPLFPRAHDLLHRTRAARLAVTHDWDGSARNLHLRELWASESGGLELRVLRQGQRPTLEETRFAQLPAAEARECFDQLSRTRPPEFRRQLGFVRVSCGLDRTHSHTLDYFDGERVHSTTLVFGSERGLGVSYGDVPPRPDEAAAFALLEQLMRRV